MAPVREPDDDRLGEAIGRAVRGGGDEPVDLARLASGARAGARRIRRRRRVFLASAGVLALSAVLVGPGLLAPDPPPAQVASPPPVSAPPAPPPFLELERSDGSITVPDEAMLDIATARRVAGRAGAGTLGSWTADTATTGWPERVPCSDGPDADEVAGTEALRERGSDDGQGATIYTSVVVYPEGAAEAALRQVATAIEDGTCEGGLVTQAVPVPSAASPHPGPYLVASSDDGTVALAVRGQGDVLVSVRVFSSAGPDGTLTAATDLADAAVQRLHDSGFLAAVEADRAG